MPKKELVYYFHLLDKNKSVKLPDDFKSTLIDDAMTYGKELAKKENDTVILSYLQNNKNNQHSVISPKGSVVFIN